MRRFYNIFTIGARVDELPTTTGNDLMEMTWGLGYGLGTSFRLGEKLWLNTELQSLHINEQENWTKDLHQLNQLKLLLNIEMGNKASLVLGPVANWMVSDYYQTDTQTLGTALAPATLFDWEQKGRSHKIWIGWNAGLRF